MMKITKRKILNVLLPVFMFAIAFIIGMKTDVKAGTWDNAADYYNTYGDRCIFSVVNGQPRVYFGSAGTIAVAGHTRYRTIGWKVSLYQNGNYQESVYCSLNGNYINKFPSSNSNGTEYNLYYINFDSLKSRFSNQAAINSGAGTLYFDAVMSIVPAKSNTPNGTVDDWGNTTGEVYDTFAGISKARGWGHPDDLRHYYNKSPEGLYRNVYVYKGTGISSVSGSGTYVYGAWATISATCSTGYDFNYWSNSSSSSSSFGVKVTSDLSYTAYGKPQTYTVSYNANGGTGAPGNQIKTYGYVLTLSSQKPTRTGYIFNYWDGSDGGTYYPGSSFGTDADTVLTAHWTPITYYVSYNKNKPGKASHDVSGIMTNSKHAYDNGISGNGYSNCLSSNQFSLKGWSFKNWNTKADGTGVSYSNNSNIKNLTEKNGEVVTLYAQWEPNIYMLLFEDEDATTPGSLMIYEKYDHGWYNDQDTKNKITNITIPKKVGMEFKGYNTKEDGTGTKYIDDKGNILASDHAFDSQYLYVYAQWTPATYKVDLDNQDATIAGTKVMYEKYSVGFFSNSVTTTKFTNDKITIPAKSNYTFAGYWTKQNTWETSLGEKIINNDGTINNVNTKFVENSKLYAKWIPNDYTVTLDSQGADISKGSSAFYEKYDHFNYTTSKTTGDPWSDNVYEYFNYTGAVQYFVAPATGKYTITAAGACGGQEDNDIDAGSFCPGHGGGVSGTVKLNEGDILYIYVGGAGSKNDTKGGYNGGGATGLYGYSGGGATHIAKVDRGTLSNYKNHTDDLILVAGGGGGSMWWCDDVEYISWPAYPYGGNGGDINGESAKMNPYTHNAIYSKPAGGGTQTAGGTAGVTAMNSFSVSGENGSFGKGGNAKKSTALVNTYNAARKKYCDESGFLHLQYTPIKDSYGAGGGGGYYGGGSTCTSNGAGGGSGFIGKDVTDEQTSTFGIWTDESRYTGNGVVRIEYKKAKTTTSSSTRIILPKKANYTFNGYYTDKNGTGDLIVGADAQITTPASYFTKDTTVYASWTENDKYNITYVANGGYYPNHNTLSVTDSNIYYNQSYTVRDNPFKRDGYKFKGWSSDPDTYIKLWDVNQKLNYPYKKSITAYAYWEPNDVNYTINYFKQKSDDSYSNEPDATEIRTAKSDSIVIATPTTDKTIFDDTGYILNNEKSYCDTKSYNSKSYGSFIVKIRPDRKTVINYYYTAQTYTLILKVADGDEGFQQNDDGSYKLYGAGTYKYGQDVNIDAWVKSGYKFSKWMKGSYVTYSTQANTVYNTTFELYGIVTLTAYSEKIPTPPGDIENPPTIVPKHTITINHYYQNSSGGYDIHSEDTTKEYIEENVIYTPKYKTLINSGYYPKEMKNALTGEDLSNGFIVTKDTTVNVYYDRLQYKIVTERYVDGVLYDTFAENAYYNEQYTVKGLDLKKCNLTGYKLDKIAVPGFGNVNSFTVTGNIPKENPIKVYYIPRTFTVTFNANSGNITDNNKSVTTAQRTVKYNHEDNNNVSSLNPVKTGYTFIGWYEKVKNEDGSDGEIQVYNAQGNCSNNGIHWKDSKWIKESNITVYAHWKANNYTLTLDANGGYLDGGALEDGKANTIATLSPTYDKTTFNDVAYLNPQRTGYTFEGWYTAKNNGTQIYDKTGKCTNDGKYWKDGKWHLTENATVYAHWEPKKYVISYKGNKPTQATHNVTGSTASTNHVYDSYGNLAENGFKLPGWKFVNWNTKADGSGKSYKAGERVINVTDGTDGVLYAQWTPDTYTIKFNKNKPSNATHEVTGTMADQVVKYDTKTKLNKSEYKLHGWVFNGWNTKADGTGTHYSDQGEIYNLNNFNDSNSVTLYAQWEATTYTITFNSNKPSKAVTQMTGTMEVQTLTYDKWENLHENKYKLEGWTFNKWNLKADGSSETSYKDKERVRNICDGKDTTLYAQWKDTTPPDASKTYLRATKSGNVNDPDYARALAVATKGSKDVTTSTSVTRTLDGLGSSTWTTSWINSDVSLDLYSYDNGTGIKLLTTYSGNNEWNKTKFTPSDNTKQVKSSKYDTSEGIEVFHGIATDDSNNSTATRNLTVKIDKTAPTGSFMVKTGTLKNPLAGTTSMIYDSNGMVTGVNPEGMRTEITATISDNGNENSVSGVKHVWAVVTDMENANISKSYKCNRISGDKYNGTYIAVDESGNKPNLYEDFSTSRKLKVKVYACDEAGNISVYKDREPSNDPNKPTSVTPPSSDPENNIVTNISMWSQIIRDDKEVPDTSYAIGKDGKDKDGHSAEGPAFLLNQSGKVHIVTYGYVEAVDVSFPPALQAAAQTDVAKGQTVKNLGTIANVNGAYVDNRLALNGDCARITDYPFIVPLYLDDTSVMTYKTNGDKWLDGITNGIKIPAYIPTANTYMPKKADGTYDIKTVDTVEIPYKGIRTVSGATVPIEPYNKNECDLRTTASFYCAKDYASKQIISITDKLHTHLVN
ncbi:InlB B-repeat-containing protein [Agathobacter rectalis]|uniref:InlB B-repeat-containing protein n=1 Tax=Agathobacter rectalis TaxID=39491 RepID=UPI000319D1A4|nr:InlB B-repeat-containing protein [Agathobacter rectalis]